MLDKDVFREQMERLTDLFDSWRVDITSKRVMTNWYNEFKHLDDKDFVSKVDNFIKNSSYKPTVAAILDYKNNKIENHYKSKEIY